MNTIQHTSSLLRKHGLILCQNLKTGKFTFVDSTSYEPASESRIAAFEAEEESGS